MTIVKNILWLVAVLLVQWGFLQDLPLTVYGNPYLYLWFFLWLPFGVTRMGLYAIAFTVGSIMDAFEQSGGAHTLACLALVTAKPWVENALIGYRKSDNNEGVSHLALVPYLTTSSVLVLLQDGGGMTSPVRRVLRRLAGDGGVGTWVKTALIA